MVDLGIIKKHVGFHWYDFTDEGAMRGPGQRYGSDEGFYDELLKTYRDGAIDHLRSIDVNVDADPLPPAIVQAVLLLVQAWCRDFRAGQVEGVTEPAPQVRFAVHRLIAPYREVSI